MLTHKLPRTHANTTYLFTYPSSSTFGGPCCLPQAWNPMSCSCTQIDTVLHYKGMYSSLTHRAKEGLSMSSSSGEAGRREAGGERTVGMKGERERDLRLVARRSGEGDLERDLELAVDGDLMIQLRMTRHGYIMCSNKIHGEMDQFSDRSNSFPTMTNQTSKCYPVKSSFLALNFLWDD